MIKLFTLKQQKKDAEAAGPKAGRKTTPGEIRIQKDVSELSLAPTTKLEFPNPDDLMNFRVTISPDEGMYKGGTFTFTVKVPPQYPHEPPKVHCETKIYHPNIDMEGNVCLNILREDWKPVLSMNSVIYGLQFLFLEPNTDDPLNKEAADLLRENRRLFEQNVYRSLRGGQVGGHYFTKQF